MIFRITIKLLKYISLVNRHLNVVNTKYHEKNMQHKSHVNY